MNKLLALFLFVTAPLFAAVSPGGQLGVAVNPSGALSFLRVNAQGALLLAALGPGSSPVPAGQVAVALDPNGALAFLNVDVSGGLIVSGAAGSGPITTSGLTESTATMLGRTTAATGAIEELSASAVKTFLSLSNVENTALSTWAGSTNVTTVGTIGTGTWNATAIADGKIASALTGKTYNGLTVTSTTGTLTVAALKTLTVSNTLTFTGTDSSSVAFGTGGTVLYSGGSYVASIAGTANQITASASTGAVTVGFPSNASVNIATTGSALGGGDKVFAFASTNGTAGHNSWAFVLRSAADNDFTLYNLLNSADLLYINGTTVRATNQSLSTGTPTGGVAGAWKHGARRTSTGLLVSTTVGVQLDVDGTLVTLATLTTNP